MKKLLDKLHIHYGWFMVLVCLLILSISYGICHNCFTLFIKPICAKFGYQRQAYAGALTVRYICLMVVAFFSGKLFQRFSVLKMMKICCIILPVSYFALSFANSLPVFYLLETVVGICVPFLAFQAITVIVANWFVEKRGTAVGIAFMGSGFGGMLFSALAGNWIEQAGYENTYRILAVIIAAVLIPLIFFVLKEKPEDAGAEPYGLEKGARAESGKPAEALYGYRVKEALGLPSFWMMILCVLLVGFTTSCISNTIVTNISDNGFTPTYAAAMNSALLGGICVGKAVVGVLFDRLGTKKSMVLSMGLLLVGFAAMYLAFLQFMHPVIVLGSALGLASGTVAYPLLTQAVCGNRDYVVLSGVVTAVGSLGGALSPVFMNAFYDNLGSYRPAFVICAALLVVVLILVFLMRTLKRPGANHI